MVKSPASSVISIELDAVAPALDAARLTVLVSALEDAPSLKTKLANTKEPGSTGSLK